MGITNSFGMVLHYNTPSSGTAVTIQRQTYNTFKLSRDLLQ